MKIVLPFLSIIALIVAACSAKKNNQVSGYTPVSNELYQVITLQDSIMFDAFNSHDAEKLMTFFDSTLEFYHDKGGLAGYEETGKNTINLFENNKTTGLRRDLIRGSAEVYPINNYGAVQTGLHTFCHDEKGKQDCGTFKFIHIWKKKGDQWKITRVISYDH